MLPVYLRVMLIAGALLSLLVVVRQVKRERILVEDSVFWVVLSFFFVVLAVFPGIAISLAHALGFMSASNFVYLAIIVLLLWKAFTSSAEISRLKTRVNELAQEIALSRKEEEDRCERVARGTAAPVAAVEDTGAEDMDAEDIYEKDAQRGGASGGRERERQENAE